MDMVVTIEANPFTVIINPFDTVPAIKMKIHRVTGIPISRQILIFQGHILTDDFDIFNSSIIFKSRIQLIFNNDPPPPTNPAQDHLALTPENARLYGLDTEFKIMTEDPTAAAPPPPPLFTGKNDLPPPPPTPTPSEAGGSNQNPAADSNPNSKRPPLFTTTRGRNNLPPPTPTPSAAGGSNQNPAADRNPNSKRPRVSKGSSNEEPMIRVVVEFRGVRTPVEVMRDDTVASLREKLQKMAVNVPPGPYFFVHGPNTMEEERSYRWHRVAQGDEILLFPGYVERR